MTATYRDFKTRLNMAERTCPNCNEAFKAAEELRLHLKDASCTNKTGKKKTATKAKAPEPPAPVSSGAVAPSQEPATLGELQVMPTSRFHQPDFIDQ